jgi:hypothetical protein
MPTEKGAAHSGTHLLYEFCMRYRGVTLAVLGLHCDRQWHARWVHAIALDGGLTGLWSMLRECGRGVEGAVGGTVAVGAAGKAFCRVLLVVVIIVVFLPTLRVFIPTLRGTL